MYENGGNEKTLEDILATSTVANMLRLKSTFMSLARTEQERRIVTLLCNGYTEADITDELKVSRQRINKAIIEYRQRIMKRLTAVQKEDIYSVLKGGSGCRIL